MCVMHISQETLAWSREGAGAADETAEEAADEGGGELDLQLKRVSLKETLQQR